MGDDEEAMLSEAFMLKSNSRLGCQIPITQEVRIIRIELLLKIKQSKSYPNIQPQIMKII
jgi:hypothetical protein